MLDRLHVHHDIYDRLTQTNVVELTEISGRFDSEILCCNLSRLLLFDPVRIECGHIFERGLLERYQWQHKRIDCPLVECQTPVELPAQNDENDEAYRGQFVNTMLSVLRRLNERQAPDDVEEKEEKQAPGVDIQELIILTENFREHGYARDFLDLVWTRIQHITKPPLLEANIVQLDIPRYSLFDPNKEVTDDHWVVTQYISGRSGHSSCDFFAKQSDQGHSALCIEASQQGRRTWYFFDYSYNPPKDDYPKTSPNGEQYAWLGKIVFSWSEISHNQKNSEHP